MHSPVSVIIPCYRCADTIERAVDSVVRQTLPPKEILLVEDCSGDDGRTLAALERISDKYRNGIGIKVLPLERNSGPGGARNAGWTKAEQPFIAFLDADDSWHPKKLEVQYRWMESHPSADVTGHQSRQLGPSEAPPSAPDHVQANRIACHKFLVVNLLPTRSVMLRKESIAYRFDPLKRHSEDYYLWLKIILNGHEAWRLELPLTYSYKADFGEGGLSGDLWQMEKGELDTYKRIYQEGLISFLTFIGVTSVSLMKYLRRVALNFQRRKQHSP